MYSIKEIYYTIQGEGIQAGRAAVFCRFSGCNLWSGLEKDRHKAICQFCDTDFWGTDGINGGKYNSSELVKKCRTLWPDQSKALVVCTGGEPLLQLDTELIQCFHDANFELAIETNGTIEVPKSIDWVCVSPKAGSELLVKQGNELKLVHPQKNIDPSDFMDLDFQYFSLQPLDDPNKLQNTNLCVQYVKDNPSWRLCLQTHKYLGIP